MELRNIFKNVFGKANNYQNKTTVQIQNGYSPAFSFGSRENIYENEVARACIDTIASHVAKLNPRHVKENKHIKDDIDFILSKRPNRHMSKYDFLYKVTTTLYTQNVAFVYIHIENGRLEGLYPIKANGYELLEEVQTNNYYLRFDYNNRKVTIDLENLIVLRRFYNNHEIFGDGNRTINNALETQETSIQGIKNAIKLSNSVKGILKYTQLLNPEDLKNNVKQFVDDYIDLENTSGIASLDSRANFEPINMKPITMSAEQMDHVNNNIYRYFRISEEIVKSIYKEESWNSFYRSVIETLAVQMSQEITNKLFRKDVIARGHEIKFYTNLLDYTNLETKIKMTKEISALGILTKNEMRELFGYPALENPDEGSKLLQSLNFVDSEYAEQYQLKAIRDKVEKEKIKEEGETTDGETDEEI